MDPFENEEATKILLRLKRQEILLESFKNHINKILKEIRKGECNFLLINQLSQFIVYYYKKNLISLDKDTEEEDKDTTEENNKDTKEENNKDTIEESNKDTTEEDTKEDKDTTEEENKTEEEDTTEESDDDKSIKQNQDTLFNHFMNNSNLKKKSLFNPNYDINENIIIFIRNSLIY